MAATASTTRTAIPAQRRPAKELTRLEKLLSALPPAQDEPRAWDCGHIATEGATRACTTSEISDCIDCSMAHIAGCRTCSA